MALASSLLLVFQVAAILVAPAALAAPAISSCSPTSGPVGTTVTITGSGFSGTNRVEFNGTDATFTANQAGTQITTTVPTGATDGSLTVTDNGVGGGTASCPSSFDVTPTLTPTVTGFAPASGPIGTSVVITGTNFTGATAVRFGAINATSFTVDSATQITATVPLAATDGPISVVNSAGTGTSSSNFDVTPAQTPTISSFAPTSGPAGTSVVITGTNFTGATAVRFGGVATTTFTVNSATQITATVPTGAATGAIQVTTAAGTATSSSSFTVTAGGPTITTFSPASGCVGSTVQINGTNLNGTTAVTFNGLSATFTQVSSTKVTATVPTGATSGRIAVTTPSGSTQSATDFTVTQCAPTIVSFTPTNGPVGTSVVISGDDFTGTITVRFDGTNAAFVVNSDTQITATVPSGADTGRIAITNTIGTGTSSTDFVVTETPTITSFNPDTGSAGSTVTITGTNFTGTSVVRFNGVAASTFNVQSDTRITAVVPTGATSGRITVTNSAGTATSGTDFTVAPVPSITSFTPGDGPVGTEVTITGSNFTGTTEVEFAGTSATFTVDSPTQITAIVPAGADDGVITITNATGSGSSGLSFVVQDIHERSVSFSLRRHLVARGIVTTLDNFAGCEAGVGVRIQRRRDGRWRTLKVVTTAEDGTFRTRVRDRQGRYRARAIRVETVQDLCRGTSSPRRIHRH